MLRSRWSDAENRGGANGPNDMSSILIVEDELVLGRQIVRFLEPRGFTTRWVRTQRAALESLDGELPDLVLLDIQLKDGSGLEVLGPFRKAAPDLPIFIMTAFGSLQSAVDALRRGATDYLQKPLDLERLTVQIERQLAQQRDRRELQYRRDRDRQPPEGVVGRDPRLLDLFTQARRLAASGLAPRDRPTILLTGETGTGKGLVARALDAILGGKGLIEVNCAAMPGNLMETELFGHERGSFTGASSPRTGLFEAAEGGTLFLDEIGELPLEAQAKLLTVIEDKQVRRLGSNRSRPVDLQILAATNVDLDQAVAEGRFRADLLHRLRVLSFELPPLRDRPEDIPFLLRHFCEELGRRYGRRPRFLSADAEVLLCEYDWPGNVRELKHVVERAVLLESDDEIGLRTVLPLLAVAASDETNDDDRWSFRLPDGGIDLGQLERDLLRQALERTGGNRTRAAQLLGLSRDQLRYRIEKHGILDL